MLKSRNAAQQAREEDQHVDNPAPQTKQRAGRIDVSMQEAPPDVAFDHSVHEQQEPDHGGDRDHARRHVPELPRHKRKRQARDQPPNHEGQDQQASRPWRTFCVSPGLPNRRRRTKPVSTVSIRFSTAVSKYATGKPSRTASHSKSRTPPSTSARQELRNERAGLGRDDLFCTAPGWIPASCSRPARWVPSPRGPPVRGSTSTVPFALLMVPATS